MTITTTTADEKFALFKASLENSRPYIDEATYDLALGSFRDNDAVEKAAPVSVPVEKATAGTVATQSVPSSFKTVWPHY